LKDGKDGSPYIYLAVPTAWVTGKTVPNKRVREHGGGKKPGFNDQYEWRAKRWESRLQKKTSIADVAAIRSALG